MKLEKAIESYEKTLKRFPKCADGHALYAQVGSFVLFDLILYVPSTIFQLNRYGSSWVEPVLS